MVAFFFKFLVNQNYIMAANIMQITTGLSKSLFNDLNRLSSRFKLNVKMLKVKFKTIR